MGTTTKLQTRHYDYVEYTETSPSNQWDITHDLDRLPKVEVWTSNTSPHVQLLPKIKHITKKRLIIFFTEPYAGRAYIG